MEYHLLIEDNSFAKKKNKHNIHLRDNLVTSTIRKTVFTARPLAELHMCVLDLFLKHSYQHRRLQGSPNVDILNRIYLEYGSI